MMPVPTSSPACQPEHNLRGKGWNASRPRNSAVSGPLFQPYQPRIIYNILLALRTLTAAGKPRDCEKAGTLGTGVEKRGILRVAAVPSAWNAFQPISTTPGAMG